MAQLEFLDRQDERWALLRQPPRQGRRSLAIFVHGFLGDYLTTWGHLPEMLRENAEEDDVLKSWDFLFLGYPTRQVNSYLDIARCIKTQWDKARLGSPPYGAVYDRLALFGHSLGTLGIRQLLCAGEMQPPGMLKALHNIILFGTPLNGSNLACYGASVIGGPIAESLKPANPQLRMLISWNKTIQSRYKWPKVKIILGSDDQIVGNKYADLTHL